MTRCVRTVLGLLLCASATAQQSDPQQPVLEERVQINLVQLPIIATDRQGKPVTDIRAEEITVKAHGRSRQVAFLDRVVRSAPSETLPKARLYMDAPGGAPVPAESQAPLDHVLLFVDVENDDPLGRDRALLDALAFVDRLATGTSLAVMAFDGESHLELAFTTEREIWKPAVERALTRYPQRARMDLRSHIDSLVRDLSDCIVSGGEFSRVVGDEECLRNVSRNYSEYVRPKTEAFLQALQDSIVLAGGVPGSKTVIALSHGVAVDPATDILAAAAAVYGSSPQIAQMQLYQGFGDSRRTTKERLIRAAQEESVILMFLDRMRAPASDLGARSGIQLQAGAQPVGDAYRAAQADLKQLGAATGGLLVVSSDVAAGLEKIQSAREGQYVLGYYMGLDDLSDRGTRLSVDCTRRGVTVTHRQDYHPPRVWPTLAGRVVLGARTPAYDSAYDARHTFVLEVDPAAIGYRVDSENASADFTLRMIVEDTSGRQLVESFHVLNHSYTRQAWDASDRAPVTIRGWVELPRGGFYLRAYLRNTDAGRGGVVETALEVLDDAPAE